uniref:Serine hydrolase n=1 Tax=Roseihalotalea indica TaxID=2867963 RepID=A0AA49JKL8_9BACT|nr:serine hydrolase [Tunicatimonas sp. TK19036]
MHRTRSLLRKILLFTLLLSLGYLIVYIARALPILTGFGAKHLCSCRFVAHRSDSSILVNELSRFPYRLADYQTNESDSFATATILGLVTRKAAYRAGAGCVLLMDEDATAPTIPQLASRGSSQLSTFQIPTDTLAYPGVNYQQLDTILEWAFSEPDVEHLKNTKAIAIIYNDTLVAERYAPGFSSETLMPGWSMTKSVINALVGISVQQGKFSVNDPAPISEWKNGPRHRITWNYLMRMSSGLAWDETYFGVSDVTRMLYLSEDMASVAINQPLKAKPGRYWYYSSGTTNILSWLLRQQWGDDAYYNLPYEKLFHPLGMSSAVIEADLSGTFVGSSYMLATTRDWAKFGLLYYHHGVWQGKQLLPKGWIDYTTKPVEDAPFRKYGAQFWLNAGERDRPDRREFPDVPSELFFAQGFDEQSIFILPSHKLVIVRLGITSRGDFDKNYFLSELIKAFPTL